MKSIFKMFIMIKYVMYILKDLEKDHKSNKRSNFLNFGTISFTVFFSLIVNLKLSKLSTQARFLRSF